MNKIISVIFLYLISSPFINSQVTQQWVSIYNGPISNYNSPSLITHDESGNIYVTGSSAGDYSGYDIVTIKYNSSGSVVWIARYKGTANSDDAASSIAVDAFGNVYVTGKAANTGTMTDIVTIKYSPAGQQIWAINYNGLANSVDAAMLWFWIISEHLHNGIHYGLLCAGYSNN
jgi:hypothetical protein